MLEIQLWSCPFVSFVLDSHVTLIPPERIEDLKEGDLMEVKYSETILFVGQVCSVYEGNLDLQIVSLVETSVASGGD